MWCVDGHGGPILTMANKCMGMHGRVRLRVA